jgi:hypothetical protein
MKNLIHLPRQLNLQTGKTHKNKYGSMLTIFWWAWFSRQSWMYFFLWNFEWRTKIKEQFFLHAHRGRSWAWSLIVATSAACSSALKRVRKRREYFHDSWSFLRSSTILGYLHSPTDISENCVVGHLKVSYDTIFTDRINPIFLSYDPICPIV